jgi:hypothetical protein
MLNLSRKLFNDYSPIGSRQDLEKLNILADKFGYNLIAKEQNEENKPTDPSGS